jgi:hypothetical protein
MAVGDVGGGSDSSERVKRREGLQRGVDLILRDEAFVEVCLDDSRRYGVDPDLVGGEFDGEVVGERVQAGFWIGCVRRSGSAVRGRRRCAR